MAKKSRRRKLAYTKAEAPVVREEIGWDIVSAVEMGLAFLVSAVAVGSIILMTLHHPI